MLAEDMYVLAFRLVVIGTAIWVGIDASRLGARRGRLGGGFLDLGPAAWFFCCLLGWIIAFPCYLITRPRLVAANAAWAPPAPGPGGYPVGQPGPYPGGPGAPGAPGAAMVVPYPASHSHPTAGQTTAEPTPAPHRLPPLSEVRAQREQAPPASS